MFYSTILATFLNSKSFISLIARNLKNMKMNILTILPLWLNNHSFSKDITKKFWGSFILDWPFYKFCSWNSPPMCSSIVLSWWSKFERSSHDPKLICALVFQRKFTSFTAWIFQNRSTFILFQRESSPPTDILLFNFSFRNILSICLLELLKINGF